MTLIEKIQQAKLEARKSQNKEVLTSLTTLEAEASAIGKNKGNRAPTDEEVISVIKKTIDAITIVMGLDTKNTSKYQSEIELDKI